MIAPESIFSYCVGALALFSTITSVLLFCKLYLPASQLKHLDELLLETREIHRKASDGMLLTPAAATYTETCLT
jgi:hypothetical protein